MKFFGDNADYYSAIRNYREEFEREGITMEEQKAPNVIEEIARQVGGKITEVGGPLPDGSGFAIMSMLLPKTHWIYQGDRKESYGIFNTPPMPFRMGANGKVLITEFSDDCPTECQTPLTKREFADKITAAGRYAVRCATMNGKDMDFDPDALIQNLLVGMLGYWTETGLSSDDWENPKSLPDGNKGVADGTGD